MDAPASPSAVEPENESPLLPAMLAGPAAFLWLWLLPIGVLWLLNFQGYQLVEGNMDSAQHSRALVFGIAGAANLAIGIGLYFFLRGLDRTATPAIARHPAWGVPAIVVQAGYLWFAITSVGEILPPSVTAWIYPEERFIFNQFAFAMLPLFLGILRLACARPSANAGKTIALNVGLAIAGPVLLFGLGHLLRLSNAFDRLPAVVFATGAIALGVLMFVGLVRALMLGLRRAQRWHTAGERAAIVVCALVLPLGGLLLNRSIPFPEDFQAWEVYALVLANAAILGIASFQHARRPRLSFYLLCATFPFSLYFFIVFLPYTPLSILAVIVMGAGFLVLTPTFLFTLHVHLLNKARRNPLLSGDQFRLTLTGLLCAGLLPAFFTARAFADKAALNAALDYVYTPAITTENLTYPGSVANLQRALRNHRSYKNGIYYPLLSDYYSWLVFDNLVLPDDKLAQLEKTFFGATGSTLNGDPVRRGGTLWSRSSVRQRAHMPHGTPPSRTVEVTHLATRVAPAGEGNSTVTFELTLHNPEDRGAEFLQTLPLPPGVFVTGFRLYINGTAVPGRIVEKKTALWVYTMIRDSERRDPGLLYYNGPGELELRVFSVAAKSTSTVEVDFLLPTLIDGKQIPAQSGNPAVVLNELGKLLPARLVHDARGSVVVMGDEAHRLPAVERESYLHLIIDRSAENSFNGDLGEAVRALRKKFPAARRARVTLANYEVVDLIRPLMSLDDLPTHVTPEHQKILPAAGGLALDVTLARAIQQHRDADLDQPSSDQVPPRPIFVVLSRNAALRTLDLRMAEAWSDLLPAFEVHEWGSDGTFVTHRAGTPPAMLLLRLGNSIRPVGTNLATGFTSVRGDDAPLEYWAPAASAWRPVFPGPGLESSATPWSRAVALQVRERDYARNPGEAGIDLKALVKASRETGVLLPVTSYIVVENFTQERMLELGEKSKLGQNAALDFLETPAPPALVVAMGFALWLTVSRWRNRVSNLSSPRGLEFQGLR